MMTLEAIRAHFGCSKKLAARLAEVQEAGRRHGEAGWYRGGDFSSDADWVNGVGAEIQALEELLDVQDDCIFELYYNAHGEALPEEPEVSDCTFDLTCFPSDTSVRGNVLASGDPAADKAAEDAINERLRDGDQWAWCNVVVTCMWEGFEGRASLGAVSVADERAFRMSEDFAELRGEAFDDLGTEIARQREGRKAS